MDKGHPQVLKSNNKHLHGDKVLTKIHKSLAAQLQQGCKIRYLTLSLPL